MSILASETSKDDIEYIDSEIDYENDDELYYYGYENETYSDEKEKLRDIFNDITCRERTVPSKSMAKHILKKTDSEQTSTPSPKRSKKYKKPNKLAIKLYFMNAIKQNKSSFQSVDKTCRKYKSDTEISLCSGLSNFISLKRKISFFKNPDINIYGGSNKTNLLNFAAKSDFNIQTVQDRGLKMSNDFKTLLKRKNSEKLRSNTPMIFISKPEEIYDENSNNYF